MMIMGPPQQGQPGAACAQGSRLEGTVYLPNGKIMINSGSTLGGLASYSIFIAKQYEINSDSTLVMNSDFGSSGVPLPSGLAGNSHPVRWKAPRSRLQNFHRGSCALSCPELLSQWTSRKSSDTVGPGGGSPPPPLEQAP